MTYAELGEVLRAEREKRRLSIDDAANELKINVRQLQALEEATLVYCPIRLMQRLLSVPLCFMARHKP